MRKNNKHRWFYILAAVTILLGVLPFRGNPDSVHASEHRASFETPESIQPLSPSQTSAPRIRKPLAPSVCGQLGFSNNTYSVGNGPYYIAVGDFNGDGKPDLASANYHSNDVSVLLGNGNGTFSNSVAYPAGVNPVSLSVADIFGDRVDDLMIANSFTTGVSYLQGAGDGTFFAPFVFTMGHEPYSETVGDLNNDGWPDLISVSGSDNRVSVRLNDQIGDFGPVTDNDVSVTPFSATIGDFNGDGNPDLVTPNNGSNNVSVLLGNGDGTFQLPINFMVGNGPIAVAVGDFNGDGKLDLADANRTANNVSVLLGNGDGLFQAPLYFGAGTDPLDIQVGDFNGDGLLDLVTANNSSNNVSVLLGYGDGTFAAGRNFSTGTNTYAVEVGDFNGDGKLDMASVNYGSNNVSVLLNTCVSLTNTPTPTSLPADTNTPTSTATHTATPLPTQTPGGPTATPPPNPTACAIQFTDVPPDNTFYPSVRCLACRGIISGYPCGGIGEPCTPSNDPYFRPGNPVSRGQLAKIVSNSAGFSEPPASQSFEDVLPGSAFYDFVERLASRGVMAGYACGGAGEPCGNGNLPYFRPASGATRGQLTKIVSNAAGFSDPAPATYTFTDVPVGSTFHIYVERLLLNRPGVMGGYACGGAGEPCDQENRPYFRPSSPLTRGQTSKIVGNTFYPNCDTPARADSK